MTEQNWEERVDAAVRTVRADQPAMTDSARTAAKARLTAAMRGEPEAVVPLAPRRARWVPLVAAAAAVVVVGTGVVALTGGDDNLTPASGKAYPEVPPIPGRNTDGSYPPLPPVSDVPLNSAERFVGHGSDLPQGPGQYLLATTRTWLHGQVETPERLEMGLGNEQLRQEWIPFDRADEWQRSFDRDVNRPAPARTERNQASPDQISGTTASEGTYIAPRGDYRKTGYWYENPVSFPANGRQLYERLREEANTMGAGPAEFLTYVFEAMLSRGDLTRDQRSVVFQALSYFPYLRVTEDVSTRDGRAAVAIGVDDSPGYLRSEVLVDPATTQVIGTRKIALRDAPLNPKGGAVIEAKTGSVVEETTITYQVVGQRGATR
ncbi:hypothetical protein [Amycolatopsis suaedae]|uniref:CU044_5270 family protein n=1 Tax=Amycolatopsis suaedae TaxID=2510978 RepID=A0A4Q7J6Q1_9PSEU|nr:hypothetical protein [Amycolatopsis suaedae]RZQ61684.1 hypothetical protein EWH70_22240 [Amycolatopsis suaedae]